MRRVHRSLWGETGGVSAIEFALIAPVFILLLLGGADLLRYIRVTGQVEAVTSSIAELIAENDSGAVTDVDLRFYRDSAMLIFPGLLVDAFRQGKPWGSTISISMASVDFGAAQSNCGNPCIYVPKMVWSGGSNPRSCSIPMIAADDASQPSPTTLPAHIYGPGSFVVVDVVYPFKPLLQTTLFSGLTIRRSFYIAPRFVTLIKYQVGSSDTGVAKECPGSS